MTYKLNNNLTILSDLNMQELDAIASDPDCKYKFLLENFSEIESLKAAIEKKTCEGNYFIASDVDK